MAVFKRKRKVRLADGRVVRKQSALWYVKYRDESGIVQCVKGYTDKNATKAMEIRLKADAAKAKEGLVDRFKEHRVRPLREHLEDFHRSLLAKGNTAKHADLVFARAQAIIVGCKFTLWGDISASRVVEFLAGLRKNGAGISAQTSNFYLQAVKQFCRWMAQDQRVTESPLAHLRGLNVKTDRRHDRRALEVDEVRRLLKATAAAPERFCMTGPERATLYRLAIETGLRSGELRSLTVSSFDLEKCTVDVAAGYSKHRRQDTLPLRKETAAELRTFLAGKLPKTAAFSMPSSSRIADMIQADLAATQETDAQGNVAVKAIPYVDEAGRFADFHALRHTCGTWLGACGVPAKTIQAIMRHCDLRVTSRYTHTLRGQEAEAVECLPDLSLPSNESQQIRATGTDGGVMEANQVGQGALTPQLTPGLTPTAFLGGQGLSANGNTHADGRMARACGKALPAGSLDVERTGLSTDVINGAGGIRTPGAFRHNGFQDRRLKPLGHCSIVGVAVRQWGATTRICRIFYADRGRFQASSTPIRRMLR